MGNSKRILIFLAGAVLLLPGGCSLAVTPVSVMSLFGYDIGIGDPRGIFALGLYFASIGYAIALCGVYLLRSLWDDSWSIPVPRWLSNSVGVLLLMPGVSAAYVAWEFISRAMAGRPPNRENLILVLIAPAFVAVGVCILWRTRKARRRFYNG